VVTTERGLARGGEGKERGQTGRCKKYYWGDSELQNYERM